jgi:DNA-binding NarL/FixJ family response regulator
MEDSAVGPRLGASARGENASGNQLPAVRLIGGQNIVHQGLKLVLEKCGVRVVEEYGSGADLPGVLARHEGSEAEVAVLALTGSGPFEAFHRIRGVVGSDAGLLPLVIVSDKLSRGHVYTALRSGASAYVDLEAPSDDLIAAIAKAALGKTYLSSGAAELVAADIADSGSAGTEGSLPKVELSDREMDVVQLLCEGHASKGIGRQLHISTKTVENHRYNIYRKCDVKNIAGLIRYAIETGMIEM